MEDYKYMVRVSCMTYNHAPYIHDAMDGFCIQKTSFPFLCMIVDDASTDGEQEVIKKYLNEHFVLTEDNGFRRDETDDFVRIYARHKTNTNCYFLVIFLKYNHYCIHKSKGTYFKEWKNSKYISLCEGDDYWIDEHKLEKQVVFLETHPDFSMCFHGATIKMESTHYSERRKCLFDQLETREYSGEELIKKWNIPTASMVYKSYIVPPRDPRFLVGDLILRTQCSIEGRVFCFSEKMSVYRLNNGGATNKKSWSDIEKFYDHSRALIEHFPQYKTFYDDVLGKTIKRSLFTRKGYKTIFLFIKKPTSLKYLF